MTRGTARSVLVVLGLLALASLATLDLARPGSLLRRAWSGLRPEATTPAEERLEELQRTRARPVRP